MDTWWAAGSAVVALAVIALALLVAADAANRVRRHGPIDRYPGLDPLTSLPHRGALHEAGSRLLEVADRNGQVAACMVLDLDNFKRVNDSLGHPAGDRVLSETARRITSALRTGDFAARLGGDEFVVVSTCEDVSEVEQLAQGLLDALTPAVRVDDLDISVTASLGVAVYGHAGDSLEELLGAADQAMYQAKTHTPGQWRRSGAGLVGAPSRAGQVARDLRLAFERDQFAMHYQPQVNSTSGAVIGYEALLRWRHPTLDLLAPGDFLPLAEKSGLMGRINSFVLGRVLADHERLTSLAPGSSVAVNMSARSLLGIDLLDDLESRLSAAGVPASDLVLEIMESAANLGPETSGLFAGLQRLGCQVSIHEFGTAQASLTSLWHNTAVREIKIHPTIVRTVAEDGQAERLVRVLVNAAHDLGVRVVAEGVETPDVAQRLAALGCDALQGSWIGGPLALDDLQEWSARREALGSDRLACLEPSQQPPRSPDRGRAGLQRAPQRADTPHE